EGHRGSSVELRAGWTLRWCRGRDARLRLGYGRHPPPGDLASGDAVHSGLVGSQTGLGPASTRVPHVWNSGSILADICSDVENGGLPTSRGAVGTAWSRKVSGRAA